MLESRKGLVSLFILVFIVMLGIGAWLGGHLNSLFFESVATKETKGKPINILMMGIDARDAKSNSRSDTMIVASIDPVSKKIAMVSIPRDTRIKNSAGKYDKINSVNLLEGPEGACKKVSELLNADVDYYVITNFGGFGDIVDALGGVHINVETAMRHSDPVYPELAINIPKGYQYLDGKQALAYVRYRGGPTADIGRTENQQKFIKALAAEMMQTKTILKLPQLIPQINKNVRTNLPLDDMIYLANMVPKLDLNNINAQTLPGYFLHDYVTGASYWEADKQIASTILDSMLKGQTFKVVGETPATAQPPGIRNPVSAVVATQQELDANKIKENAEKLNEEDAESDPINNPGSETDAGDETRDTETKKDPTGDQTTEKPTGTTSPPVEPKPPLDNIKP